MSSNLALATVLENQSNKEATINDIAGDLDAAISEILEPDFTSGNVTVTDTEFRQNKIFEATNLTTARTLTIPDDIKRGVFVVDNTAGTAVLTVSDGTGSETLQPGEIGSFYHTGVAGEIVVLHDNEHEVSDWVTGTLGSSLVMLRYVFTRDVIFPATMVGSRGDAGVAANAQTDVDLQKDGVSFGTMRWAASGTVASFIAASATTFNAGNVLDVIAPGSADANLADVSFTLIGHKI